MNKKKLWRIEIYNCEEDKKYVYVIAAETEDQAISEAKGDFAGTGVDPESLRCIESDKLDIISDNSGNLYSISLMPMSPSPKQYIKLIRTYPDQGEAYVDTFALETTSEDAVSVIRGAVEDFLTTPDGRNAMKKMCGEFNWTDALNEISSEFWNEHGINILPEPPFESIWVIDDEVLGSLEDYRHIIVSDEGYWSNQLGWVEDKESATVFKDRNVKPAGG
jgi:hypothetical protein